MDKDNGVFLSMEEVEGHLPPQHSPALLKGNLPPWKEKEEMMKVFVYGSLMKGLSNHRCIAGADYLGTAVSKKRYRMVSFGGFPAVCKSVPPSINKPSTLVAKRSIYRPLEGEVYKVDDQIMAQLDRLESNGFMYKREIVPIVGCASKAWMYILMHGETKAPLVALNSDRNYSWRLEVINKKLQRLKGNK